MKTIFRFALGALLFALCTSVEAQQPTNVHPVAWLTGGGVRPEIGKAFREGLRDLGYIEGKNISIDWRVAQGKRDQVPALAADLVRAKVQVIVTGSATDTRAAKAATTTIPIVMTNDGDPVGMGFINSLARPGGNITGLSTVSPEIGGKRLELLHEIVPRLTRVAVFGTSTSASNARELKEVEAAATILGLKLDKFDVLSLKDFEPAFRTASKQRADAGLWLVSGGISTARQATIAELAANYRLPTIYDRRTVVEAGGLVSYGLNLPDLVRRAATYVDKILKGAKPGELPVEQPTKFELAINLKTAKQIGLSIPPNVLARADKVIR
jgi:putative ABC transport system substrate-binding protein